MRRIIFFLLRFTGFAALFQTLFQRKKVSILLLHDLDARIAEKAFAYFSRHYNLIELDTYLAALRAPGESQLPANAMVLTFDDGHIGNYDMLPSIIQYRVPVTIYLCASIVDTNRRFWFLHRPLPLHVEDLKHLSNTERLQVLKEVGFSQRKSFDEPQALQDFQISKMKGIVDFQAHTHFHPILPSCNDEEAAFEIGNCKTELENKFGLKISSFAFPNGDYSERDVDLVKRAGYESALTVDFGFNDLGTDRFRLKRIPIDDTLDVNEVIVKATGLWSFLKTRNGRKQECGLTTVMPQE